MYSFSSAVRGASRRIFFSVRYGRSLRNHLQSLETTPAAGVHFILALNMNLSPRGQSSILANRPYDAKIISGTL
ncbi:hypothetical protein [Allomesorhizobium camelthorni]|uniref:Uncharacterized protein n=1 Tax=Allomesorhizobium camelthorni TaxID=475069 RepID=A0A6G4WNC1_9HYPH|nr:hypothetical protein [Mesorhizobium camelthorni]NGO55696.1 hypothetical protein [Mesorhizobium camelthorni]